MSCRICKRATCTESFHSIEEQELFAQREAMPDDIDQLRCMVQQACMEITEAKKEISRLQFEIREKSGFI